MEKENYGSPWQEFFNSRSFKKIMETAPEVAEKMMNAVKDSIVEKINIYLIAHTSPKSEREPARLRDFRSNCVLYGVQKS